MHIPHAHIYNVHYDLYQCLRAFRWTTRKEIQGPFRLLKASCVQVAIGDERAVHGEVVMSLSKSASLHRVGIVRNEYIC